jgi:prevent-host-death family protein
MKTITIEELQKNFEFFIDEVESGKSFVIKSEDGDVVILPYNKYKEAKENFECFCNHNDGC